MMDYLDRAIAAPVNRKGRTITSLVMPYYDGSPGSEFKMDKRSTERFAPGCFDEYLASNAPCFLCFNHETNQRCAKTPDTLKLWADRSGLHFEATLNNASWSNDLLQLIDDGEISGSSVRFAKVEDQWSKEGDRSINTITKAILQHVAPCYTPAFANTYVSILKDRDLWEAKLEREMYAERARKILEATK